MPIVDFGIVTALQEEFEYIEAIMGPFNEVSDTAGTWYRTSRKAVNGTSYEIVLAWQDGMGPMQAQGLTVRLIDRWDPAFILLVGIAGQVSDEVKLGDIVVGQQVIYYDLQAVKDAEIEVRPEGYPAGIALVRQAHAVKVNRTEMDEIRSKAQQSAASMVDTVQLKTQQETDEARGALKAHSPAIHVGSIASGSKVVKSEVVKNDLLDLHGKMLAVEMEGCGLMHGAFFHRENPSQAILIKGISDAANESKAKLDAIVCWRKLATQNSARLALAIIQRGRLKPQRTDQFELDPRVDSIKITKRWIPEPIRPGYSLLGFQSLVVPQGPLTRLKIVVTPLGVDDKELPIVKGIFDYKVEKTNAESEPKRLPSLLETDEVIKASPVGVYLLVDGMPAKVRFDVTVGWNKSTISTQWTPGVQRV
jgi:adenosylhomocysteine nucleosidase